MRDNPYKLLQAPLRWIRTTATLAVVLLSIGLARPVAAQDVDAAREEFRLGNDAYNGGDYERAIGHFEQANRIVPNARLELYIGQCYLYLGEQTAALEHLQIFAASGREAADEVASIIADLETEANAIFNVAQRAVDSAWRLAAGEPPAETQVRDDWLGVPVIPISIRSDPPGAEVFIDDESLGSLGRTPLTTELFAGPHHIIIAHSHYRTVRERVDLQRSVGQPVRIVNVRLERANVPVNIRFNPATVHGYFLTDAGDTIDLGTGSYRGELPAGHGIFILQRAGSSRRIERSLSNEGGTLDLTLNLNQRDDRDQQAGGTVPLIIRSSQPDVIIEVDGDEVGRGEGEFEAQLRPGIHQIRVTRSGFETIIENLTLYEGERSSWTVPRMYPQR